MKELDLEEMRVNENSISAQETINTKMEIKRKQTEIILAEMNYFQNYDFKKRVAEFLQWSLFNSGIEGFFILK